MALPDDLYTLDHVHHGGPFCWQPAQASIALEGMDAVHLAGPFVTTSISASAAVLRLTQGAREVLRDADDPGGGALRITQLALEVLSLNNETVYLTQAAREVLRASPQGARKGTSWMVFQNDATLDVYLASGTLSSAASKLAVLNGANAALVGSEIIQFRDVTSLGSSRYRLSCLLRGRFGTEWAMGSHQPGETFVLLEATSLRRILESTADLNQARFYKAVSLGQTFGGTITRVQADTGISLKPWAPVFVRGTRDGSDNLTLTWQRRARVQGEWRDYVDVPIAEQSEAYELDILDPSDNSVVRTIEAATTTASYSAADQTTDFGSPQATITVRVYQLSETIGRGYGTHANV